LLKDFSAFAATGLDIGFRCRVIQSSAYEGLVASSLYPARVAGGFFFHTAFEQEPWIIVDLGAARVVGEIRIWNREDIGIAGMLRALPLAVSCSDDGISWRPVAVHHEIFGGRISGKPARFEFSFGLRTRFLRVSVLDRSFLNLDYVEILQFVPVLQFGSIVNLHRAADGLVTCEYVHERSEGLYSNFSTAMNDVVALGKAGIGVKKLDLTRGFVLFKDQLDKDVYPAFFSGIEAGLPEICQDAAFGFMDVHEHYRGLPLARLNEIASKLYSPSRRVLDCAEAMMAEAGVMPARSIAIVYRGTDKVVEIPLAPVGDYIAIAKEILLEHPDLEVIVQTDQAQARAEVLEAFGEKCRFFDRLPVTEGKAAMHNLNFGREIAMAREEFAVAMMAAVRILSGCAYVVTHTGNIGAWLCIYRGNAENVYQFDKEARLVRPG